MKKLIIIATILGITVINSYGQTYITKGLGSNNITFTFSEDKLTLDSKATGIVSYECSFQGTTNAKNEKSRVSTYIILDPVTGKRTRYKVMLKYILSETVDDFTGKVSSVMFQVKKIN